MDDRITELAHELKTPLTGVLGAIDLVLDAPVSLDDTEIAELLAVARSEANQLRSIIDGVVQRTRLDAGTLQASREPVSSVQLVEDTLARFPSVSDRTALVGDTALVVSTDRSLAEQILTNLIQNVARYAPTGPVAVDLAQVDSEVHITVTDSGPGLPGGEVPSSKGLGVGLSTSRQLAETLGGSLHPVGSTRGASLRLALPVSHDAIPPVTVSESSTPPPRARLLQEVADLLVGTSLDRILTGVGRLARQMLGASAVRVFERRDDRLVWLISEGDDRGFEFDDVAAALLGHDNGTVTPVDVRPEWLGDMETDHVVAVTMHAPDGLAGLLVVGWRSSGMPGFANGVLPALAALALVGVDRRFVGSELEFERRVRAEVMDSLPIAISVFAGDPPRLIDWNQAEEELLALTVGGDRPAHLAESQEVFGVRFEDGTPLTMDNAPIVEAIRTGRSSGPFYLRLVRRDGSEVVTRTHCAAIRDRTGAVIGAVVTSEPIGPGPGSSELH
ncbi:MAG: ATP-binding protein [Acidimicrobiia bacterium]